ncbi:MAG: Bax inhibitor-1 family protein [Armatimonadetes bacterium]|nr:Bax inhibitor-1 family protein [Armatimonadota bacterium]
MSSFENYVEGNVADAPLDARLTFIRKTYAHLVAAVVAFVAVSGFFYSSGVAERMLEMISGSRFGWLMMLGGFMLLGWLAGAMASMRGTSISYVGLGLYTVAEALIFSPMIFLAAQAYPGVLTQATGVTLLVFGALTFYVLFTRRDFSFLRTALFVGGIAALGLIVAGAIFGFNLGLWFSFLMVIFAAGAILYTTSQVLHQYRTDQYVAAALALFAAVALLFWYVLRIFMSRD